MAIAAPVVQYRKEMVEAFRQRMNLLGATGTKETVLNGNQATFVVGGSATDTAVTRGTNGYIPYGTTTNSQVTITLAEKHATYEMTKFNIFSSQGDQTRLMQEESLAVINRDVDLVILNALSSATNDTGATQQGSLNLVLYAQAILGNNDVPVDEENNVFGVISPAFRAYLMQTAEFSNGQWVDVRPFNGPARKMFRWNGVNWIVSTRLTGLGTSSEICYMYHRNALGYAANLGEENVEVDYDKKQDLTWSRATLYHGATILQNSGIVKITHDGSAYAAQ